MYVYRSAFYDRFVLKARAYSSGAERVIRIDEAAVRFRLGPHQESS